MPVVFLASKLKAYGIKLPVIDPAGCADCEANQKGAFATRAFSDDRVAMLFETTENVGPSTGITCNRDRTAAGGQNSKVEVHCVRVEAHR